MKPQIGQTVLYVMSEGFSPNEIRPAMVVTTAEERGWNYPPEHQIVQLQVFIDGTNDFEGATSSIRNEVHDIIATGLCRSLWKQSVKYDPNKAPGTWHHMASTLIGPPAKESFAVASDAEAASAAIAPRIAAEPPTRQKVDPIQARIAALKNQIGTRQTMAKAIESDGGYAMWERHTNELVGAHNELCRLLRSLKDNSSPASTDSPNQAAA